MPTPAPDPSPARLAELAPAVERIARDAGLAVAEVYAQADLGVEVKRDESPLTEADRRSEAVIQRGLAALDTGYLVVSEESRQAPYAERARHATVWMVDPLDGTKEFVKRNGEFCVCIALVVRGEAVLGVVHAPVTQRSYVAWRGGGAHVSDAAGEALQPLPARARIDLAARGLRFCVSRSHLSAATEAFLADFDAPEAVPMGSALKFCGVADGRIDVYPRHAPTMEWDTAAAQVVLEEAGGRVVEHGTDRPLRYNKPDLVNPHFVAYAPLAAH